MLGNTGVSSGLAMVTFVGRSFLNRTHCLGIYSIVFLVELHVCFLKGLENMPSMGLHRVGHD